MQTYLVYSLQTIPINIGDTGRTGDQLFLPSFGHTQW